MSKFPIPQFPDIPGVDVQSTLDGRAQKIWEDYTTLGLPKHLIRHDKDFLECTCGYKPKDMLDWSRHATQTTLRMVDHNRT